MCVIDDGKHTEHVQKLHCLLRAVCVCVCVCVRACVRVFLNLNSAVIPSTSDSQPGGTSARSRGLLSFFLFFLSFFLSFFL